MHTLLLLLVTFVVISVYADDCPSGYIGSDCQFFCNDYCWNSCRLESVGLLGEQVVCNCNDRGTFINGSVCLCEVGWTGRNCTLSISNDNCHIAQPLPNEDLFFSTKWHDGEQCINGAAQYANPAQHDLIEPYTCHPGYIEPIALHVADELLMVHWDSVNYHLYVDSVPTLSSLKGDNGFPFSLRPVCHLPSSDMCEDQLFIIHHVFNPYRTLQIWNPTTGQVQFSTARNDTPTVWRMVGIAHTQGMDSDVYFTTVDETFYLHVDSSEGSVLQVVTSFNQRTIFSILTFGDGTLDSYTPGISTTRVFPNHSNVFNSFSANNIYVCISHCHRELGCHAVTFNITEERCYLTNNSMMAIQVPSSVRTSLSWSLPHPVDTCPFRRLSPFCSDIRLGPVLLFNNDLALSTFSGAANPLLEFVDPITSKGQKRWILERLNYNSTEIYIRLFNSTLVVDMDSSGVVSLEPFRMDQSASWIVKQGELCANSDCDELVLQSARYTDRFLIQSGDFLASTTAAGMSNSKKIKLAWDEDQSDTGYLDNSLLTSSVTLATFTMYNDIDDNEKSTECRSRCVAIETCHGYQYFENQCRLLGSPAMTRTTTSDDSIAWFRWSQFSFISGVSSSNCLFRSTDVTSQYNKIAFFFSESDWYRGKGGQNCIFQDVGPVRIYNQFDGFDYFIAHTNQFAIPFINTSPPPVNPHIDYFILRSTGVSDTFGIYSAHNGFMNIAIDDSKVWDESIDRHLILNISRDHSPMFWRLHYNGTRPVENTAYDEAWVAVESVDFPGWYWFHGNDHQVQLRFVTSRTQTTSSTYLFQFQRYRTLENWVQLDTQETYSSNLTSFTVFGVGDVRVCETACFLHGFCAGIEYIPSTGECELLSSGAVTIPTAEEDIRYHATRPSETTTCQLPFVEHPDETDRCGDQSTTEIELKFEANPADVFTINGNVDTAFNGTIHGGNKRFIVVHIHNHDYVVIINIFGGDNVLQFSHSDITANLPPVGFRTGLYNFTGPVLFILEDHFELLCAVDDKHIGWASTWISTSLESRASYLAFKLIGNNINRDYGLVSNELGIGNVNTTFQYQFLITDTDGGLFPFGKGEDCESRTVPSNSHSLVSSTSIRSTHSRNIETCMKYCIDDEVGVLYCIGVVYNDYTQQCNLHDFHAANTEVDTEDETNIPIWWSRYGRNNEILITTSTNEDDKFISSCATRSQELSPRFFMQPENGDPCIGTGTDSAGLQWITAPKVFAIDENNEVIPTEWIFQFTSIDTHEGVGVYFSGFENMFMLGIYTQTDVSELRCFILSYDLPVPDVSGCGDSFYDGPLSIGRLDLTLNPFAFPICRMWNNRGWDGNGVYSCGALQSAEQTIQYHPAIWSVHKLNEQGTRFRLSSVSTQHVNRTRILWHDGFCDPENDIVNCVCFGGCVCPDTGAAPEDRIKECYPASSRFDSVTRNDQRIYLCHPSSGVGVIDLKDLSGFGFKTEPDENECIFQIGS